MKFSTFLVLVFWLFILISGSSWYHDCYYFIFWFCLVSTFFLYQFHFRIFLIFCFIIGKFSRYFCFLYCFIDSFLYLLLTTCFSFLDPHYFLFLALKPLFCLPNNHLFECTCNGILGTGTAVNFHKLHFRSHHQRRSIKKGVLRNFVKLTGKHLLQSLFQASGLQFYYKRDSGTGVSLSILRNF